MRRLARGASIDLGEGLEGHGRTSLCDKDKWTVRTIRCGKVPSAKDAVYVNWRAPGGVSVLPCSIKDWSRWLKVIHFRKFRVRLQIKRAPAYIISLPIRKPCVRGFFSGDFDASHCRNRNVAHVIGSGRHAAKLLICKYLHRRRLLLISKAAGQRVPIAIVSICGVSQVID